MTGTGVGADGRTVDPIVATAHLCSIDARFGAKIRELPPCPAFPGSYARISDFQYLVRAIVFQQIAGGAARAIFGRVKTLGAEGRFPKPGEVLELSDEALQGAGLSRNKIRAVRSLASEIAERRLRLRTIRRRPDDEVIDSLTTVWGIGEWTAQIFLMFKLGRPDVMPSGDLGVQEGLRRLDGLDERPGPAAVLERAESWKPIRSVASWYLWRMTDA